MARAGTSIGQTRRVGGRADLDGVRATGDRDVRGQVTERQARQGVDLVAVDVDVNFGCIGGRVQDAHHGFRGGAHGRGDGEDHRTGDGEAGKTPESTIHDLVSSSWPGTGEAPRLFCSPFVEGMRRTVALYV